MRIQRASRFFNGFSLAVFLLLLFPSASLADHAEAKGSILQQNFRLLESIAGELELIRLEVGGVSSELQPAEVENAQPFEVFSQLRILYENSNHFLYEYTHSMKSALGREERNFSLKSSLEILYKVHQSVSEVKETLRIPEEYKAAPVSGEVSLSRFFSFLVQVNRNLSLLLIKKVQPSDVFAKVFEGMAYLDALLAEYPSVDRVPDVVPFQRRKTPSDVREALFSLREAMTPLIEERGGKTLRVVRWELKPREVQPPEVYSVASLVVADLKELYRLKDCRVPVKEGFYPGMKTPSEVFQWVTMLKNQLMKLQELMSKQSSLRISPLHRYDV